MENLSTQIYDRLIDHQTDILRLEADLQYQIRRNLGNLADELAARIAYIDPTAVSRRDLVNARVLQLLTDSKEIVDKAYSGLYGQFSRQMRDLVEIEEQAVIKAVNDTIGVELFNRRIPQPLLIAASNDTLVQGATMKEWWARSGEGYRDRLADEIRKGALLQESIGDIVNRVRGVEGLEGWSYRQALRVSRTSIQTIANEARHLTLQQHKHLLNGMQWVSTLDQRTSPICQVLDQQTWDMDGNKLDATHDWPGPPPAHWNCRSTIVPIVKSIKDLAKNKDAKRKLKKGVPAKVRASADGEVPANMNYEQWLKTKAPHIQQEILGPTKYSLWQSGRLPWRSLVDQSHRPISVEQLREKYSVLPKKFKNGESWELFDARQQMTGTTAEALSIAKSTNAQHFVKMADDIDAQMFTGKTNTFNSITAVKGKQTVSRYAPSSVSYVSRSADMGQLSYNAAMKAHLRGARSTLEFRAQQFGPDSMYRMRMGVSPLKAQRLLDDLNLPRGTVTLRDLGGGQTEIYIFDKGTKAIKALDAFGIKNNIKITQYVGQGITHGGKTVAAARAGYTKAIKAYEKQHPEVAGTWDRVRGYRESQRIKVAPKPNVPDVRKPPPALQTSVLEDSIDYVKTNGEKTGNEYASLWDAKTGELLVRKTSNMKSHVSFSDEVADGLFFDSSSKHLAMIHNHPNGNTFSNGDLGFALVNKVRHMYVYGNDTGAQFYFRIKDAAYDIPFKILREVTYSVRKTVREAFKPMTWRNPQLSRFDAIDLFHISSHLSLEALSRAGLLHYEVPRLGSTLTRTLGSMPDSALKEIRDALDKVAADRIRLYTQGDEYRKKAIQQLIESA